MMQSAEMTIPDFVNIIQSKNTIDKIIEDEYLIVAIAEGCDIDFSGKTSKRNQRIIKDLIQKKEYHEVSKNIYRMVLPNAIFIYRKFGRSNKVYLVGRIMEKNERNRLDMMEIQTQYLMQRY